MKTTATGTIAVAAAMLAASVPSFAHDSVGKTFATRGACEAQAAKETQKDFREFFDLSKEYAGNHGDFNRYAHAVIDCVPTDDGRWTMISYE